MYVQWSQSLPLFPMTEAGKRFWCSVNIGDIMPP
jgi:hypothetical protein